MITLFKNKGECCGCSACSQICPKNAISMITDEKGFLYPSISSDKCIECNACKTVCPIQNKFTYFDYSQKSFALKHLNAGERKSSSSGGAFIELAKSVINNNGSVYGAAFDKTFKVKHIRVTTLPELEQLKKSKYVQSDITGIYSQVKTDLNEGHPVLFSGTGCQVQGLKNYLKKPYDNLLCVDIVCHGVPSQKVFDDYLSMLENKYKSKIISVNFRGKAVKNKVQDMLIKFENGKTYSSIAALDSYYSFFIKNFDLRESCYSCQFSCPDRTGDISLADFWKIENQYPEFQDYKGISLLLINSEKGQHAFDTIKSNYDFIETPIELAMSQSPFKKPFDKPHKSDLFWNIYISKGYDACVKKLHFMPKLKYKIKRLLK